MGRHQVVRGSLVLVSQPGRASEKEHLHLAPPLPAVRGPGAERANAVVSLLEQEDEEQCQTRFQPH